MSDRQDYKSNIKGLTAEQAIEHLNDGLKAPFVIDAVPHPLYVFPLSKGRS